MGQTRRRHDAGAFKPHVKTGDEVLVLSGRSKGERGRVLSVDPQRERAVVEGINQGTKHEKPRGEGRAAQQQGGRITINMPIHVSNLMVLTPSGEPTRVAHKVVNGKSIRVSRRTGEPLDKD